MVEESDLGSIRRETADNFPILQGMSLERVVINPGAMRLLHWHANANELTYCVSGTSRDVPHRFEVTASHRKHRGSGELQHAHRHLPDFPFTRTDPLIFARRNPVDEHAIGEE